MFDYNGMIQRAIQFFPTWSDIRKRYKESTGGKLLGSVLEEITDLDKAIAEYRKYYFLDTYEGHEDDVMALSYRFPIGTIDVETIKVSYNKQAIEVTEDVTGLLEYKTIAYYELGNIYINDKLDPELVEIRINEDLLKPDYELVTVWNIFDEFACFVGLERHNGEKNSELVDRILHINRYKPNASIEGLQNAIMSELLTEFPDISREDMQFERVNDENLRKAYKGFDSLLDYLNSINCDVYRWKRWDLNKWQHDFKSISYISAVWDESISNFKNGIGYGDDCEAIVASNLKSTDATITLYNKSKETMNKYLADKNIEKDISIQFKRYNDILNNNYIDYTIKASPLTRLYPEQINLNVYQEIKDVSDIPLEFIYSHGHNVEANDANAMLSDHFPYRLKFEPVNNCSEIKVEKAICYYLNRTTGEIVEERNLLKEKTGFIVNSLGNLVSTSIKRSITKVEDFDANSHNGFVNMPNNGGIKAIGVTSTGSKTLYNLGGQQISYEASCELSDILNGSNMVKFDSADARWEGHRVIFNDIERAKKIEIKFTGNQFTFDVLTNNTVDVLVRYGTSGQYTVADKASMGVTWSTEKFNEPRYMEIVIMTRAAEEVKVGNFKYCNFNVQFQYKIKSNFIDITNNTLPASNNMTLKVIVSSKSGGCPVLSGIYIGSHISSTTYVTDSFETKNNCYRRLDILTDCKVTLVKRDVLDTRDTNYKEDYNTNVSYKATDNDAYIRLKLDDYSYINNIIAPVGQIETVEESGVVYYNLSLTEGQTASVITIDGVKNQAVYNVSLLDMINRKLKNYTFNLTSDRVYCSRLVKGIVVIKNGDQGQTELIKLDSSLFAGIESAKYVFSDMPSNIGIIWGTGDEFYSDSITGSFDYVSFYNENDRIHVANNIYNLFINEIKDIPIAENFTEPDAYDKNKLNFYTVECNTDNMDVRFYNYLDEGKAFDDLQDWTVGIKNLYLKNTSDYENETIYDIRTLDYSNKEILAEYINLKDSYLLSANNTIYTEQYIVVPPEGMTVEYKEYDGTSETQDLLKSEAISVDRTMFKKLKFSNIDRIMYIGTLPPDDGLESEDIKYTLLKDEGIIVWNEPLTDGLTIYLKYTIKKPVALNFDLETLYKLTGYTVETYRELNSYFLINMEDGSTYDLNNFSDFKDSDLAYIQCSEPSFEGQMINEHTVRFNKHVEEKTVLVKTGYYYFNGREYYLFSEDGSKALYNNKHMLYDNVDISDDYIYTYKATNNYVRNSEMLLRSINDLYSYDCSNKLQSPKFNKYTACNSYNDWITFNTTLTLTDELYKQRIETGDSTYEGFNDVALKLAKKTADVLNYAYIDITEFVTPETYITLAATKDLKIFIGEEQLLGDLEMETALSVVPIKEMEAPIYESCVRTSKFDTKNDRKYYLIVQGEGIIDDIIISDLLDDVVSYHVKNLEKLGLLIEEQKIEGAMYKMKLNDLYRSIDNNASICSDGYIRTVGNISWNITKIKTYDTAEDFNNRNCYKDIQLIVDDYVKAPDNSTGRFITDYVQINPAIVNRLLIKVNDIMIDDMDNFKITILSTDDIKRNPIEILTTTGNYAFAYGHNLYRNVKAKIEIPEGCVIDKIEILVEYKSTEAGAPALITASTGSLISPVFDSQQSSIYTIKNININDISNINDVEVYIRAMTDNNKSQIWTNWNELKLTTKNGKVVFDSSSNKDLTFRYTPVRFFQFKITLKSSEAYIDFNSLDIEVVE